MYYNTTKQKEEVLENFVAKAQTQDGKILEFFNQHKGKKFSPGDVWTNLFKAEFVPLTSIRRSINSLTKEGQLTKLDEQKVGYYGRPVYLWILK